MNNLISTRIKELRGVLNLTASEFAKHTSLSNQNVSILESGSSKPGTEMLEKIANATSVRLDWLLLGKGGMFEDGITPEHSQTPIKVKELKPVVGKEIADVGFWQKLLISAEDKVRILSDEVAFLRKQNEYLIAK